MEKNIVEVVMNNKGEVVEKVADYIGVVSFAAVIESVLMNSMTQRIWKNTLQMYSKRISSLLRGSLPIRQTRK